MTQAANNQAANNQAANNQAKEEVKPMTKSDYDLFCRLSFAAAECKQYKKQMTQQATEKLEELTKQARALKSKKAKENKTLHHLGTAIPMVKGFPVHLAYNLDGVVDDVLN